MIEYEKYKSLLNKTIEEWKDEIGKISDDLADHPELSGKEYESSRKWVDFLRENGYQVEYPFDDLDTAFRGIYGSNHHKYKIVLMAEYDALPEIGHACGHCLSGGISILAGMALRNLQEELDADIHIIGTPIEEVNGAKCKMVEDGIFTEYDMAMMVHLYDENLLAAKLQAIDTYIYHFYGKSAHASAMPWEGINALNAVQLMFHAVDMLRQHVTPDVRIHGVIRDGGMAPNIVPEHASAEFFIRTKNRASLGELVRKVDDCARGAAIATQADWKKESDFYPYDDMNNNASGTAALKEVFEELDLPLNGDVDRIFGSSDAGNVSYVCPTFHPCLQLTEKGICIHTRKFAEAMKTEHAHEILVKGAKLIAYQTVKIFSDPKKIQKMKEDFIEGNQYQYK